MVISIIAAVSENGVIGKDNALPWNLPADLKHFKGLTIEKPVIMGLKTFKAIGKPLPNRTNIVLSKEKVEIPGCTVVHSIEEALQAAGNAEEVMIIGGGSVYAQFLPKADRMYLTKVHAEVEGDTYFPEFNQDDWKETAREEHEKEEQHPYSFNFITLERKR